MEAKPTNEAQGEMTFIEHLKELRQRLVYCLVALGLCFVALFVFANDLYGYVSEPLRALLPEGATMIATDVTSPFFAPFRLALFFSLVISMPFILFHVWRFMAPGLYKNEKRFAVPMFGFSVLLFYAGMAFAYYVVFRLLFGFFLTVGPDSVVPMTDISSYLNFVLKILIAFGLAFQIPIATLLLLRAGLVEAKTLARKRPYIFIGCFVCGMLITPPDIFSQAFVAVPMWVLFELGLILHRIMEKKPAAENDNQAAEDDPNTADNSQAQSRSTTASSRAMKEKLSRPSFAKQPGKIRSKKAPKGTTSDKKRTQTKKGSPGKKPPRKPKKDA